jgi:magnesium chelatase family protein
MTPGMPAFSIVGLPDKAVSEARERVRAALTAMSIALPSKRITINLSPADLPKEGSHFDLPIALAMLAALGILPKDTVEGTIALGELSLDGALVPVLGAINLLQPLFIYYYSRLLGLFRTKLSQNFVPN